MLGEVARVPGVASVPGAEVTPRSEHGDRRLQNADTDKASVSNCRIGNVGLIKVHPEPVPDSRASLGQAFPVLSLTTNL